MTQKGKYDYLVLVLMNGTGEKGWGGRFSFDFVYFVFCVMCVFILHWALSVQKIPLAVCCLLLETDLTILPLGADPWLV